MPAERRTNTFRFNARYALLTYAQCGDLDPGTVGRHLESLGSMCIIGHENHADGGIHLHAFLDFGRKFSSREARVFDVGGFHPNILPGQRTPAKMYDYAIKDSAVVYQSEDIERPGSSRNNRQAAWDEIVACDSREAFTATAIRLDPRTAVTCWTQLNKYADYRYAKPTPTYKTPEGISFDISGEPRLGDWVDDNLWGWQPGVRCVH